jgi:hypothetical protein
MPRCKLPKGRIVFFADKGNVALHGASLTDSPAIAIHGRQACPNLTSATARLCLKLSPVGVRPWMRRLVS